MSFTAIQLLNKTASRPSAEHGLLLKFNLYHDIYNQRLGRSPYGDDDIPESMVDPFKLLFGLYHGNPAELDSLITKLVIPLRLDQQYPLQLPSSTRLDLIKEYLYPHGTTGADALASDIRHLIQLDSDTQNILGIPGIDLTHFPHYARVGWPFPALGLKDKLTQCWEDHRNSLGRRLEECFTKTRLQIEQFLKQNSGRKPDSSDTYNEVDLFAEIKSLQTTSQSKYSLILFAVSGSGKTRSIHRLLSRHFGFYFQACNLPSEVHGIHGARRITGSNDTLSLGKMIQYSKTVTNGAGEAVNSASLPVNWLQHLVENRTIVLAWFLKIAADMNISMKILPQLWLELQLDNDRDFFDETFQLFCLIGRGFDFRGHWNEAIDYVKAALAQNQLYYCLDEGQAELTMEFTFPNRDEGETISLLTMWAQVISTRASLLRNPSVAQVDFILSGTSLKTEEAVKAIEGGGFAWVTHDSSVFSAFPAITNDVQFEATMVKHGLADYVPKVIKSSDRFLRLILGYAKQLYGRPRWSIQYLERIKPNILNHPYNSQNAAAWETFVRESADNVVREVKTDLQGRLLQLHDSYRLMQDLCRVTVWSDLLDRPAPFWDEFGPEMISKAFANMRTTVGKGRQYFLEERLALEAAKEFFLAEMPQMIEHALGTFLQESANNASNFGKTAECFLAWNLSQVFVDNTDRMHGSGEAHRLAPFLTVLNSAESLNSNNHSLNLSDHTLVRGEKIGHAYDGSIELVDWMKCVRRQDPNNPPNATFFFPENNTGPDLMFALQPKSPLHSGIVLCLFQLKCGDAELEKGIKSTDLSRAYYSKTGSLLVGYEGKARALQSELTRWRNAGLPLLRVLVTAAVAESKGKQSEQKAERRTPCAEYFIRCDATRTEMLFGSKFKILLSAVRDGNQSLSQIYRRMNDRETPSRKAAANR